LDDVLLCPVCMNPFQHFDDLQVHLLSEHGVVSDE
jgi:hypothetical protein